MGTVPDRFLGFAFCIGDLLIEMDANAQVLNVDGAAQGLLGDAAGSLIGQDFLSLVNEDSRLNVRRGLEALTGKNRRGPMQVRLIIEGLPPRAMTLFLYRLPVAEKRYCAVLVRPYRLNVDDVQADEQSLVSDETRQETFFSKMTSMMAASDDNELMVSVLDNSSGEALDRGKQGAIERTLKAMSVDGASATRLAGDKYAVIHDRALAQDLAANLIAREVSQATGVNMDVASIDADPEVLSEEDGLKALIHGLKKFADNVEGYAVSDIKEGASELIGQSTAKVKIFRRMISEGAFTLVYQPIVNLRSGRVHHFEALSRFDLPGLDESPFQTICFAEDVGLIDAFDLAVLQRVISTLKEWCKMGRSQGLAVNVSGYSLSRTPFLLRMMEELKAARDLAGVLSLEVTESSSITDLKGLADVLATIRTLGFTVYLDDFGAGASGFQYLRELKPDALKIDGSYVREATKSATDRAFLKSMVSLCQDLGILTVAEWIEDHESATLLTGIGVDMGQGYFFGKPMESVEQAAQ